MVFYKDGVIVAQAPDILWLRDTTRAGGRDEFAFDIDDGTVNRPPLADALFHDVVFDGSHPSGAGIGLAHAAVEDS